MADDPWIGDTAAATMATCGFHLEEFGDELCGAASTIHICSESAVDGLVSLATCDLHASIARAAGLYVGEHPFSLNCTPVKTVWFPEGCRPAEEDA